jgi:hypothetical protein
MCNKSTRAWRPDKDCGHEQSKLPQRGKALYVLAPNQATQQTDTVVYLHQLGTHMHDIIRFSAYGPKKSMVAVALKKRLRLAVQQHSGTIVTLGHVQLELCWQLPDSL